MISYQFNKDLNVLFAIPDGDLLKDHAVEFYNSIEKDNNLPRNLNIIIDAKGTKILIRPKDLPHIRTCIISMKKEFKCVCIAVLHSSSLGMALASLMTRMIKIRFKGFSTEDAALQWLNKCDLKLV